MPIKYIVFLLYLMIVPNAVGGVSAGWTLEKTKGYVKVYSRPLQDGAIEIKATTSVKASVGALISLLDDISAAPEWIDSCSRVQIIQMSKLTRLVRVYYHAPWPFKDRDMVVYSVYYPDQENDQLRIIVLGANSMVPRSSDYIRMENVAGEWLVKRLNDEEVEIQYQGKGLPGGNFPQWLSNHLMIKSTFNTFVRMSQVILNKQYQRTLSDYQHLDEIRYRQ